MTVTHWGDLFFRKRIEVGTATSHRVRDVVTHPGEWTVTVDPDGSPITKTWDLTDTPPGDLSVAVAGDGTVTLSHVSGGVPDEDLRGCDKDGYPYESSTPGENVDTPVGLRIVDRSARPVELTVTIHDGETQVYEHTVETATGEDKVYRPGLLAKKTSYTVTVRTDDGRETTETVTLTDGATELVVLVTEDDELRVSLS